MDELEIYRRRAAVKRANLKRLGVTNIRCLCGETDPVAFEVEHIFRRGYDDTVWGRCISCHRKKSAREQSEHPPVGMNPGDPFERMGHALLGMREYDLFEADHLKRIADVLFKLAGTGIVIED